MIQSSPTHRWWTNLVWRVYEYLPVRAENYINWCLPYILPFKNLLIPIVILRGRTRMDGHLGTLLVAGVEHEVYYLIQRFFEGEYQRKSLGKVPLWSLVSTLKELRTTVDLTIARIDRLSCRLLFGADYLAVPEWVGSMLTVPEDLESLVRNNDSLKSDLRIVDRNKLTPSISEAEEDFEEFYHRMYVPFICNRHGTQAFIRHFYWMRRAFHQGGILWVLRGGQRISGVLFRRRGNMIQSLAMGTANGQWDLVKKGANFATDLYIVKYSKKLGFKLIEFGGSRPSLNDGVLRYKRKWGMNLVDKQDNWYNYLVYWNRFNESVTSFFSNNPLIFRDNGGLSAISLIHNDEPATQTEAKKIHRSTWMPGLSRLYIIATSGWKTIQDSPPKTVLMDLKDIGGCNPLMLKTLWSNNERNS
jgi:hypothetical protein